MMKLARRLALILLAAAAAVALAGTSARSAPQAAKPKLTSFGTCGQLLGYAKGQAKRFVGPYGYGSIGRPVPLEALPPVAARAAAPCPVQGVDFSGTNVQEEGVDEPDLVKTNGNTVFAVANGKLRAVDVAGAQAAAARLARARTGAEPRAALARRPPARGLARRLLDRAAARDRRRLTPDFMRPTPTSPR